jgi:hypothetical protein
MLGMRCPGLCAFDQPGAEMQATAARTLTELVR